MLNTVFHAERANAEEFFQIQKANLLNGLRPRRRALAVRLGVADTVMEKSRGEAQQPRRWKRASELVERTDEMANLSAGGRSGGLVSAVAFAEARGPRWENDDVPASIEVP